MMQHAIAPMSVWAYSQKTTGHLISVIAGSKGGELFHSQLQKSLHYRANNAGLAPPAAYFSVESGTFYGQYDPYFIISSQQ